MSGIESLEDLDDDTLGVSLRQMRLEDLVKASFGGDRSAAGRYAAEQRWKNHQKKEEDAKGRKGGGSLDDEIRRVSDVLKAVGDLPFKRSGLKIDMTQSATRAASVEQYEKVRDARFVDVVIKGKTFTVVSQAVIDAEKEVNALGKRVLTEIGEKLVAEGKVTQKELDDAISFQDKGENKLVAEVDVLVAKAVRGDDDVPDEVREAAIELSEARDNAKEAKSVLIKATKAYNKSRQGQQTLSSSELRQLFDERREAKNENILAKRRLADAEAILEARAARALGQTAEAQLASDVGTEKMIANSVRVQGLIGEEVRSLLSSKREMMDTFPTRSVSVIPSKQSKAAELLKVVAGRLPMTILTRTADGNGGPTAVNFTTEKGGSYNPQFNVINADTEDADTLTHETVHNISYFSTATRLIEQAALQRRVFGKADDGDLPFGQKLAKGMQKMVGATQAMGYRLSGKYVEDKFVDGYQGRMDYNSQPSGMNLVGATETLTVSTETAFGGSSKFRKYGRLDRDLLHTAIGWLLTAEGGA